ncbi:serine protease 55-like [Ascaphus truei]|uniref:serine protease 55-like n=1 Tax=Ascaphus truei TaxID=8439 RepID=UPI003F5A599F
MYRNQITYATSVQHCNIGIIFLECGTRPLYDTSQASGTVGGGDVNVGEFPWQVSIQNRNSHFCGGSILNNWWILTAAHCFLNLNDFTDVTIVVGITDLKQKEKKRKIQQVIAHAGFDKHMNNDVALVQVKAAIRLNKQSAPVCLPKQNDLDKWRDCWATGWGFTGGADAVEPNILKKVAMQLLSSEKCAEMNKVSSNILCAGYEEGGNRLCQVNSVKRANARMTLSALALSLDIHVVQGDPFVMVALAQDTLHLLSLALDIRLLKQDRLLAAYAAICLDIDYAALSNPDPASHDYVIRNPDLALRLQRVKLKQERWPKQQQQQQQQQQSRSQSWRCWWLTTPNPSTT